MNVMRLTANRCIIFTQTRHECCRLYRICSPFFSCTYVYSDLNERRENIEAFRKGEYRFIFATTVLERGITIPGIDVIILDKDGRFDKSAIIQMLGRVGRKIDDDKGKSMIIAPYADKNVKDAIASLKKANSCL